MNKYRVNYIDDGGYTSGVNVSASDEFDAEYVARCEEWYPIEITSVEQIDNGEPTVNGTEYKYL